MPDNQLITPPRQQAADFQRDANGGETASAPFISIIVPIYNTEKYLRQCVESVLNQDFRDYELWLIDDGSSDSSIDIIKEYAAADPRIKTAFIKGHGPSVPRNYGLQRALGEYIYFIDSDDYLPDPGALSRQVKILREHPDLEFLRGNQWILIEGRGELKSVLAPPRAPWHGKVIPGEELLEILAGDNVPQNAMLKRSFLEKHRIRFNEEMSMLEDVVWTHTLCAHAKKCMWNADETYTYRLGAEGSITNTPKNYRKIMSLASIPEQLRALKPFYGTKGKRLIDRNCITYVMSPLFAACSNLSTKESLEVLRYLRKHVGRLPWMRTRREHDLGLLLWQVHPLLAWGAVKALHRFAGHK